MKEIIQKLDNQAKLSLLSTTLVFAVLLILSLNLLDFVMYVLLLLKEPNHESIFISFRDGHYIINDKKMGFSFFYNFIGMIFFWILIIYHTLKSINKPFGWNLFIDVYISPSE